MSRSRIREPQTASTDDARETPPLVAEGQGRTPADAISSSDALSFALFLGAILLALGWACR